MSPIAAPHILVLGGAYAGLAAVKLLQEQINGAVPDAEVQETLPVPAPTITVLDERDGVYHTIGTPLAHTSSKMTPKAWMPYSNIPYLQKDNIRVLRGKVDGVDCATKTATYTPADSATTRTLKYDYLIVATGIRRPWPVVPIAKTRELYLLDAARNIAKIENSKERIVVIGGGAVGVEFAAEMKTVHPSKTVMLVHSHSNLLTNEPLPEDFKAKALELLIKSGVEVCMSRRVMAEEPLVRADGTGLTKLVLDNGDSLVADDVMWAVGRTQPNTDFLPQESVADNGLVKIRSTMSFPVNIPNADHHFAVGDLVHWPGIKRVGSALVMGRYAATNILRRMAGKEDAELEHFPEVPGMLVLAVGKEAVAYSPAGGLKWGVDTLQGSFEGDLGLRICWSCIGLEVKA